MHRSGTSLVTEVLNQLGLFVGIRKDPNFEAIFFHNINNWLFSQSGGSWDHPDSIKYLLKNREILMLAQDCIQRSINSPKVISYLGWSKYFRYPSLFNFNIPWGWKDPKNTFTLPLWLSLFPNAKVIHVYRHGVDVAKSIIVRESSQLNQCIESYGKRKFLYFIASRRSGFTDALRCTNLEDAFTLREEYTSKARSHVLGLKESAIEIKYEDFLEMPIEIIKQLVDFCGLKANDTEIISAAKMVKMERAYAYRNTPELVEFADLVSERLKQMSY